MIEDGIIISPDTLRANRVPPGQHLTTKFPVLHYGSGGKIDTSRWKFSITGLVEKERELDFVEFAALKRVKVLSDIHCVTTWSRLDNHWEQLSLDPMTVSVKQRCKVLPMRLVFYHRIQDN